MFRIGFTFLIVAGLLGILLRVMAMHNVLSLNYHYILHAHSHTAFLAWVFNAFFAYSTKHFVGDEQIPAFKRVFWVMQFANVGMLIAFPVQGYAAWSIAFSTIHLICSIFFAWRLYFHNTVPSVAKLYLRTALVFMILSSIGPIMLGPLAALDLRESPLYTFSIYSYMHFQYNGWFIFFIFTAALSATKNRPQIGAVLRTAYPWLSIGCLLTLAQSAIWTNSGYWVNLTSLLGATMQLVGCAIVLHRIYYLDSLIAQNASKPAELLLRFATACLIIKFVCQFAGSLPGLESLVSHRYAAIGFLHLVFLGVVTPIIIAWAFTNDWIRTTRICQVGVILYLSTVSFSELILFYLPISTHSNWTTILYSSQLLGFGAAIMVTGLALIFSQINRVKIQIPESLFKEY